MKILNINSSSNKLASTSASFADKVVAQLIKQNEGATVVK